MRLAPCIANVTLLLVSATAPAWTQQPTDSARAHRRVLLLPAIGSAPETGLQYGITLLAVSQPASLEARRPTSVQLSAIRTMKGQLRASLDVERWTHANNWRFAMNGAWQQFPVAYFGIGADAPQSARELYTPRGVDITGTVQRRVVGSIYALAAGRFASTSIVATDTTGILRGGSVTGSRGGQVAEFSAGLLLDTRDNVFAPRSGQFVQIAASLADQSFGSDFGYTRMRADARAYHSFGTHVLAVHAVVHATASGTPFDQMALVGGSDILRGYAKGRYRDRSLTAAQVEYRTPMAGRFGAVAFAGAGTIGPSLPELASGQLLASVGAGARVQLDRVQRTAIRIDYARGSGNAAGLYIGFNQAF